MSVEGILLISEGSTQGSYAIRELQRSKFPSTTKDGFDLGTAGTLLLAREAASVMIRVSWLLGCSSKISVVSGRAANQGIDLSDIYVLIMVEKRCISGQV